VKGARAADRRYEREPAFCQCLERDSLALEMNEMKVENFHVELLQFAKSANMNFNLSQK
jgi:hypothetical protein